jgi:hypothetical protein
MRRTQHFTCARCGKVNPDFLTFGVGNGAKARNYCLNHIPWLTQVRMWIRERRGDA